MVTYADRTRTTRSLTEPTAHTPAFALRAERLPSAWNTVHQLTLDQRDDRLRRLAERYGDIQLATLEPTAPTSEAWFYGQRLPNRDARRVLVARFGHSIDQLWAPAPEAAVASQGGALGHEGADSGCCCVSAGPRHGQLSLEARAAALPGSASTSNAAANGTTPSPTPSSATDTPPQSQDDRSLSRVVSACSCRSATVNRAAPRLPPCAGAASPGGRCGPGGRPATSPEAAGGRRPLPEVSSTARAPAPFRSHDPGSPAHHQRLCLNLGFG